MSEHIDIVFDGPPSHESGRFVEVEDQTGKSIRFGDWVERDDGYWVLRFPDLRAELEERRKQLDPESIQHWDSMRAERDALRDALERIRDESATPCQGCYDDPECSWCIAAGSLGGER